MIDAKSVSFVFMIFLLLCVIEKDLGFHFF